MCGITGIVHYRAAAAADVPALKRMCASLSHRGPDDEGFFLSDDRRVALAHRRLSIIDLANGKQPMANATGTLAIVFNGEIYNFRELRHELQARGRRFATTSDTEVILALYEAYGEAAIARLNGIFAFAIFDARARRVVLARDHFGVKPLYYADRGGRLVFGSEIKAILAHGGHPRELDLEAFSDFLTFRYNPSPDTLFKGIRKLPPGCRLTVEMDGECAIEPFWKSEPQTNRRIAEPEAVEEYSRLLDQAVRRQLVSDVPVGLLLSGGVDSAVLACLMRKHSRSAIQSFTIGFEGSGDYNELADARESARLFDLEHREITLSKREYLGAFARSFTSTEEPIAETTIPALHFVSRLAADHVKVVLAGQGADEPMAGYARYRGVAWVSRYGRVLERLPLGAIAQLLPRNERFKRALLVLKQRDPVERLLAAYTIFTQEQKQTLLLPRVFRDTRKRQIDGIEALYRSASGMDGLLSRMLYVDARMSLSDNLLLFNDKITMANSLEMRVPFLDLDLVAFIESLPAALKLRGLQGKYIHKRAVKRWLPESIVYRKKRGFQTPMDEWLQTGLGDVTRRILREPGSAAGEFFDLDAVDRMIAAHQSRRENHQRRIFALLSFECWYRTFFRSQDGSGLLEEALVGADAG